MTDEETRLCKYVDLRFEEHEKRLKVMFDAKDLALQLSSDSLEKRLDAMNQFRAQIKEERLFLLPRAEYIIQHERLVDDIRILRESKAMLEGKASQSSVMISLAIAVIGIGISLVALLLH